MNGVAGGSRSVGGGGGDNKFDDFISEVKEIEKRDSVLTSKQQIDRLLRPGSTYFNLNPFEVLQIHPTLPLDQIKKKYRSMSILVHPDKNQEDLERAQNAFEAVNRAWKVLENELTRSKCMELYDEAKGRTDLMIAEKKKKLKKEGKAHELVPEEEPSRYENAVHVLLMKLFAEMERKRQQLDTRDMEERKRKRENEMEEEDRIKAEREYQKNFEESRQNRVNSWQNFQAGGKKKKKEKKLFDYSTPKLKPESR